MKRLWGSKSGRPEGDRLDDLATLINACEVEQFPMQPLDPVQAIRFRVEQQRLTCKDLEPLIGWRNGVAEVLNPRRGLSIGMILPSHALEAA